MNTIELDCAPGWPRPGDLLPEVIKDTGLTVREPVGKLFGCWTWDYSDIPSDHWEAIQPTLAERIKQLHRDGTIRYGSW